MRLSNQTLSEDLLKSNSPIGKIDPGGGLYVPTFIGDTRFECEVLRACELGYWKITWRF
jgi:hypothetical protein